ncbi:60kDa protein [Grapevine leafroll-associated virus 10]|uniref:60kDa protein n=1 Tax=Grapevine leafroll-associated virus 10 TaxID=367121 RepID=UPI0001779501|nr:60kDa protein [Grapevine leafroll-associated virus 10]CAJ57946.2 60kDa protein [Grapevine leafroll-associated virus 10]
MALSATSSYVKISSVDEDFRSLLRSFKGEDDVDAFADDIFSFLNQRFSSISGKFTLGDYSCSTWYSGSPGAVNAWPDSEGWGRHLFANYIVAEGLLSHMYYPLSSEITSAVATPKSVLVDKLQRVGKPVTETSPFPYKVSRVDAKRCAAQFGVPTRHTEDLVFCVGNYLGRLPEKEEILGEKALPVAAVRKGSLVLDVGADVSSNERRLALMNLRGKNKQGDPVEGVYFKTRAEEIKTVASFIFEESVLEDALSLPGVTWCILSCLKKYPVFADTFEDRIDGLVYVQTRVREILEGLIPFKTEVELDIVLSRSSTLKGEVFRGDAKTLTPRFVRNTVGGVLMRVGSRFSVQEYSELTRKLVAALLNKNLNLDVSYTQAILIILQRYIHYRTNALRFVNLPVKLEFLIKGGLQIIDFSEVDVVFGRYQSTIPEIERAWCAPLADVAYMLLKDTGGSFAKWKDLQDIPAHMNFDFVGYVDPKLMSSSDLKYQTLLLDRFRSKDTPVRGFQLGARGGNPVDHLLGSSGARGLEKGMLRRLIG